MTGDKLMVALVIGTWAHDTLLSTLMPAYNVLKDPTLGRGRGGVGEGVLGPMQVRVRALPGRSEPARP